MQTSFARVRETLNPFSRLCPPRCFAAWHLTTEEIGLAIYHLSIKTVSRSSGRSAVAAAAYRSGEMLADERTGELSDYRRKRGVEYTQIVAPADAPAWVHDRAALWNAAEAAERRKNSVTAREYEIALPAELTAEQRQQAARTFGVWLAGRFGVVADIAIHAPGGEEDQRNHHAHILTTTRVVGAEGLGEKTRVLDDRQSGAVEEVRSKWAEIANAALERAMVVERVDHRSHERRGIEVAPTVHLGPAAAAMERRGIETERGGINRLVAVANLALSHARQMVERAASRAKETANQVMDRGARIMAELAQTDTGKLDEALQIRQVEKILQERQRQRQQEKARTQGLKKGPGPGFGRGL